MSRAANRPPGVGSPDLSRDCQARILALLSTGPRHGFQLSLELEEKSGGAIRFNHGALYPLLHKLEQEGLIRGDWLDEQTRHGRKSYALTEAGRRMARTNRQLERRLREVEELTARAIEQERRAVREEAERRLLEADNERKTAELEEARALQLEMLPKQLPQLEAFDLAVRMTPANEVAGDYYDFATDSKGGCTLAVGDATGHGVRAGMMVAVAKSLFQTAWRDPSLSHVLQRIDAGLGTIRKRAASMAMLLVRLDSHRLRVASAGMPPVLLWRRRSGELEELLLPAAPLGTALADGEFREREVELERGDAALIMTDGLAEATDPDGDPLGYDQAGRLFAEAAQLEPEAIIYHLVHQTRLFLGGTPLGDDMTLLVLKAKGPTPCTDREVQR